MNKNPKNIVITGASSGIGAALAKYYAKNASQGHSGNSSASETTIALIGRNADRLEEVAKDCREFGVQVVCGLIDVTCEDNMRNWLENFDSEHPIDLIVANAGISGGTAGGSESEEQVRSIFKTNIDGVLNTILPVAELMKKRRSGQIAIVSSLAGMRGLPSAPAYSASKAAVKAYGEGLRGDLAKHGVGVSVICPGYIKTPMTDVNDFPMPLLMSADKASAIIARGLGKNKSRIAFPFPMYFVLWLVNFLPVVLSDKIFASLPGKK